MARVILVTGGSRSGKSSFAQAQAEALSGPRLYLATSPVTDQEMAARIERHRRQRDPAQWRTQEEELDLVARLEQAPGYPVVLVDCLTLWINNLLHDAALAGRTFGETEMAAAAESLLAAARRRAGTVFCVTNEVGLGIVPANAAARVFRDVAGRCNQVFGAGADELYLVCCGVPLRIKG